MQNYHRHSSYSNIYIADSAVMNERLAGILLSDI